MPSNERVSVIIATNRGGPFLAEALQSAFDQTLPPHEVVLIDDGAVDPTPINELASEFPQLRILHQENTGSSVARNNGVLNTTGEFLVFLDDDDRWHSNRLARHVDSLRNNANAVVSYCGMRTIDASGREVVPADQVQVSDLHEVLQRRTGIILPNIMIRRETFFRIGGFHPSFRRAQDLDLVLKAALEGDFVFVDQTLVDYRFHEGNNTRRHRELCRSIDRIVRLHKWAAEEKGQADLVADHVISLAANSRFAAWSAGRASTKLAQEHEYRQAVAELAWAAKFAPTAPMSWLRRRLGRAY